ncbi:MAG: DUF4412 domain-containing protein [Bacteroidota bacterium]|nr:DUF4412 domain-containing protein [Bacteroidota bacterium]
MKKAFQLQAILMVIFLGWSFSSAYAGKPFEGVITYKITYPDSKYTESQLAMFPKTLTVSIKGEKSRTEINSSMGAQIQIMDYSNKSVISLVNVMGQKYAIRQTPDEVKKAMEKEPKGTVKVTDETKVIAGYNCKKAIVSVNDDGEKTDYEVYFTTEMGAVNPNFDQGIYRDVNGVMMEFLQKSPQISMKFTATSVEKKSISSKEFEIPSDYTITTMDEMKSKFGSGME